MSTPRTIELDRRYSDPAAEPTPWADALRLLSDAELYWITTVRADGRPHVTPLVGVLVDGVAEFCTGLEEQKARNLQANDQVVLTTGNNNWTRGTDVVLEGAARRVTDEAGLHAAARAYLAKYGRAWQYEVRDGLLVHAAGGHGGAALFRIEPHKVLAFAKHPHGVTRYRFG